MLTDKEAIDLMNKYIKLKKQFDETGSLSVKSDLNKHEKLCMEKFSYLVTMKTNKYKAYDNYSDIQQEGYLGLIKSMQTYKPKKSSFFYWAHRYIDTRISRAANLHSTIRYPFKFANANPPHKETIMPLQIEFRPGPEKQLSSIQDRDAIKNVLSVLTEQQRKIVYLSYGLDGDRPIALKKICDQLNITRNECLRTLKAALLLMRDHIQI